MLQRSTFLFGALAVLFLFASAAYADKEEDARQTVKQGLALYDQKRYQEALDLFLKAMQMVPERTGPYREAARCYDKLEKPSEAIHYYTEYLRRRPDAPEKQEFEQTLLSLEAKLPRSGMALVSIDSEPKGAAVYVLSASGEPRGIGFTPVKEYPLDPGVTEVRLLLASYPTIDRKIQLSANAPTSLTIPMKEAPTADDTLDDPQSPPPDQGEPSVPEGNNAKKLLYGSVGAAGSAVAFGTIFLIQRQQFLALPADDPTLEARRAALFVEAGLADASTLTSITLGALWLLRRNDEKPHAAQLIPTAQGISIVGALPVH